MPKPSLNDLIPQKIGRRGNVSLRSGFMSKTFIGPELGERIAVLIERESMTASDFFRAALVRLLEEYE